MPLILPNTIANDIPADGAKVQQNFATIQSWANQEAITRDGSTGMTAPLLLPGVPTQPNQAATKGYVDSVMWAKRITLNKDSMTGGVVDFALDFGVAPIGGIGVLHLSGYIGFSSAPGRAAIDAFTNTYTSPTGGPWVVRQGADTVIPNGGQWYETATVTLMLPVTEGQTPNCFVRFRHDTPNLYARTVAVIQVMPGTW